MLNEVEEAIRVFRFFDEVIEPLREVLAKHGARLEVMDRSCIIYVPKGTVRQRLWPIVHADRYEVILPDGYTFHEAIGSALHGTTVVSSVSFDIDDFPLWVQRKYRS